MKRDVRDAAQPVAGERRLVLLGASNLTKSIGTVLDAAAAIWGAPLEVMAALGHGRSYGRDTGYLGLVRYPGIRGCGLWDDLAEKADLPTAALVTDIGNDLLYEEPVEEIAGWVERCLDRLAHIGARTIVTVLPLENVRTLSAVKFRLFRTAFYPFSRIELAEVSRRAVALDVEVRRLARERNFALVEQQPGWYGFDPIHIRWGRRGSAWREILSCWADDAALDEPSRAILRTLYLRTRPPERHRVLGIARRGRKPAVRFTDGTSVAIY